jgi:queuine tRNA-ribosyltransferase
MKLAVSATDGKARAGVFFTKRGQEVRMPTFMPVGTKGTVKGINVAQLKEIGAQIMLVNTYHLWLRPGSNNVATLGGIKAFSGWQGPVLSDSGGFQIFSLAGIRKLDEDGVTFRSHLDGQKCRLTPETAVKIQEELGVDIAMVLDECPKGDLPYEAIATSLELTLKWAKRCIEARSTAETTALFGITQGGGFLDLRRKAIDELGALPFDGFAIGGLSVGEEKSVMYEVLEAHAAELPKDRVRYLMGVGTPQDLVKGVHEGVDIFDCVMPTRSGRFGRAFVSGRPAYLNLRNAEHSLAKDPLDERCDCFTCQHHSRAYLHHLFRNQEMLGPQLLSLHNLRHYLNLMERMREAILVGRFTQFYQEEMARWS